MENKMETTIVYWDYIGIMENKLETTILPAVWGCCTKIHSSHGVQLHLAAASLEEIRVNSARALATMAAKRSCCCPRECPLTAEDHGVFVPLLLMPLGHNMAQRQHRLDAGCGIRPCRITCPSLTIRAKLQLYSLSS